MTLQLPAHLQGRQSRNVAAKATAGLGALLPPHISIRGNSFTLVDAAGTEYNAGPALDVCVIDSSELPCKRYYRNAWTPDSNEPPTCFSANGLAPSRDASEPQARTCAECQWNVRGSAVSRISGAAIKACRDEKWLAVILPQYPSMIFQLVITPGSFDAWKKYTQYFKGGVDISDVVTHISFEPQVNGVLMFEITGYAQNSPQYISADLLAVIEQAWADKKTDVLVGRNDVPIALPPPAQAPQQAPQQAEQMPPFASGAGAQTATPSFAPQGQPSGLPTQPATPMQVVPASATTASPSSGRRRRNTAAQTAPQAQPMQQAPFMPQQPAPAAPAGQPNGQFGMEAGAAPNPELAATLQGLFGNK